MINKPKKIIVIGGNAAGPAAAAKAKRYNPEAEVQLFEQGEFISTGTCELPYLLSGEIEDYRNIVFFDEKTFFEKKGVITHIRHRVENINRKRKEITVRDLVKEENKTVLYDSLVLCTGSKTKWLNEIQNGTINAFTLKSVSDFLKINDFLKTNDCRTIVIVGSGYIGLEVAEAFRKKGLEVIVIEKDKKIFPSSEPESGLLVRKLFEKQGIELINSINKPNFYILENRIKSININSRLIYPDLVLSAVGIEPNTIIAEGAGLEIGKTGAIKTDNKQKTSDNFIYSAGDNSEIINFITNKPDYLPLATNAHYFGHIAGVNAAGGNETGKRIIKNIALKLFDCTYVSVGMNSDKLNHMGISYSEVMATTPNLIKVMPESGDIFGKILFDRNNGCIFGAEFFGKGEVAGYGNIISLMIKNKIKIETLGDGDFNYHPPVSPFINILSILGKKAQQVKNGKFNNFR